MAWQQIASGTALELLNPSNWGGYEDYIAEGQRGRVEIDLRAPLPPSVVSTIQSELGQRGVAEASVTTGSPMLIIQFRKTIAPLVIIAIIVALLIIAMVIGWRIFKEVFPEGVPAPISLGLIVAVVIIAGLAIWKWRR